jgi:alpha-galactosidase
MPRKMRAPLPPILALAATALAASALSASPIVAPTPPMGWNSWDAFGFTIDEDEFKANAAVLATLKPFGWSYAVIDEGWYMADPLAANVAARHYRLDSHGRLAPVEARFPSAAGGSGLGALAAWTHARGLEFGIHIVRGIPREAVERNLPIAGSHFHAADAADRNALCPWDEGNYGIADNDAGQAWYDSLIAEYAGWGVDFLKVDCIADHPWRPTEIRQIAAAIAKTGRPIVLSLSPGPTDLAHADEVAREAQMWRIADDFWDGWTFPHPDPGTEFPTGVRDMFDRLERWNPHVRPGHWPDADMLPLGSLRPHPGWGEPRQSRLGPDEARTALTLWAIARSPLILGGNLAELDPATRALLTNREILALNQRDGVSRPAAPPPALGLARIWLSTPKGSPRPDTIALFNLDDQPLEVDAPWTRLGLAAGAWSARNLWDGASLEPSPQARFAVPPHGVAIFRLSTR